MSRLAEDSREEAPRLGELVARARRSIRRAIASRLEPFELTGEQFAVLGYVSLADGSCLRDLARAQSIGEPTASRILATLCARDLVSAKSTFENRRRLEIHLTESGSRLLEQMQAAAGEVYAAQTHGIGPPELQTTARVLERIIRNMNAFVAAPEVGQQARRSEGA